MFKKFCFFVFDRFCKNFLKFVFLRVKFVVRIIWFLTLIIKVVVLCAMSLRIFIWLTRMLEDIFSKKYCWVDQGPIDKIGRATRLPAKNPAVIQIFQHLQLNNFCTQSLKCIIEGFICSSIVGLHMDSIISKIRSWRIELDVELCDF